MSVFRVKGFLLSEPHIKATTKNEKRRPDTASYPALALGRAPENKTRKQRALRQGQKTKTQHIPQRVQV